MSRVPYRIYKSDTYDYLYIFEAKINVLNVGNEIINGYLKVGTVSPPINVTIGDITGVRLMIGQEVAFSATAGRFAIFNGVLTDTAAGNVNAMVFAPTAAPAGTSSSSLVGTLMTLATANNQAFVGSLTGAKMQAIITGSGDMTSTIGCFSNVQVTGNQASNHGLLTVSVAVGGAGYLVGDVLTVNGGTILGTVQVTTIAPGGVVLTVTIITPGTNYGVPPIVGLTTVGGTGAGCTITLLTRASSSFTNVIGHQVQALNANGAFTTASIPTATGLQVMDIDVGSGPNSVATQVGVDIRAQTKATTNTIGLRIAPPTTATNNYSLQFSPAVTTPAGGITWDNDVNLYRLSSTQLKTDRDFVARHLLCGSTPIPTVVAGTGTGNPVVGTPVTVSANSNDQGMQITIVTTAAPAVNATIFTLTFATAFPNTVSAVVFSPRNTTASALSGNQKPFVSAESTTTFTFRSNGTALAAGATYIYNFAVRA